MGGTRSAHAQHRLSGAEKSFDGIDANHALQAIHAELRHRLGLVHDAGVVGQGIQAPELYIGHREKTPTLIFSSHIRLNRHGMPAQSRDLRSHRVGGRRPGVPAEEYLPASTRCLQCSGCTDAAVVSGNEHGFVFHGARGRSVGMCRASDHGLHGLAFILSPPCTQGRGLDMLHVLLSFFQGDRKPGAQGQEPWRARM